MTVTPADSCRSCGGRGWKLLSYRRSHETTGSAGECAPLKRGRVACLFCGGTGSVRPVGEAS
jgi:hypothetical protein